MMGLETLLALLTTISMLCAVTMCAFAYRLNEKWDAHDRKRMLLAKQQDDLLKHMNETWTKILMHIEETKNHDQK